MKGYFRASVQLDSVSRTDKLILGLIGGISSLGLMLLLNRFGVLSAATDFWYSIWTSQEYSSVIRFHAEHAVRIGSVGSLTGTALLGILCGQSVIAYIGGYLFGTHNHVVSDERPKSREDLEQPWERAVKDSVITGEITVITKQGEKVRGELYRIGSPSEDYDVLLSGAEKIVPAGKNEPLGVTYHHHRDISRVEFDVPGLDPDKEFNTDYDAWLARAYRDVRNKYSNFRTSPIEESRAFYHHSTTVGRSLLRRVHRRLSRTRYLGKVIPGSTRNALSKKEWINRLQTATQRAEIFQQEIEKRK